MLCETWYQPKRFFLATSRELRSVVERWEVWGWGEWIRHKVYRPWMMAHEVRHWTPSEAILAVLRVLHKNPSSSFDLCSLGSKMEPVDFCLKKRYFSEAKPSCCLSVIFSIFMPDFWQIRLCYLTQGFSILPWKQGTHSPWPTVLQLCSPPQIKCLSRKFDWDFVWPLNWVDRARAWLSANAASNRELESGGSIDPPVTFTRLA